MRILFILLFLFSVATSHSQGKDFEPKGAFKFDIQLPIVIGNKPMKSIMKGMVKGSVYYQHNVFKGLNVGVGGHYLLYTIDEFALYQEITGAMHEVGGFGKISYQKFFGEKFGFEFGVKAGYAHFFCVNDSSSAKLGKAYDEGTFFVEPVLNFEIKVHDALGINLAFGWTLYGNYFDQRFLSIDELPGGNVYKHSNTNMINLGFGISYYFGYKNNLNTQ
ncbi:MAG: hypothetical protein KDC84_13805 [Crocinitomicaceae bacterium]|nr:hypothetical protein [Crocinitomicaceae bacterium]